MTMLCENPQRKTGLTTTFYEFVSRSLRLCPDVSWILFAGPDQDCGVEDKRVEIVRSFPANDHLGPRLWADHFRVSSRARRLGAQALVTVGFVPMRKTLPTVMHIFSLQHLDSGNRLGLFRQLYRQVIMRHGWPRADLIIINSDYARDRFLSVFPSLAPRVVKSYEGLKHEQYEAQVQPGEADRMQTELGLRPGYLLWVSNLYPYKQVHLLLEAYALLDEKERAAHPLFMVGGNWVGVEEKMTELVQRLGISPNVRFSGWVAEHWLAPLYRHALAYCLSSREETFGRTVTEAQACGAPCLLHDIPVLREVTGGAALLVDFNDRQATVAALRRLINDPPLRQQLRQAGLANVGRFSFDTLTVERIDAIRKLISGSKR